MDHHDGFLGRELFHAHGPLVADIKLDAVGIAGDAVFKNDLGKVHERFQSGIGPGKALAVATYEAAAGSTGMESVRRQNAARSAASSQPTRKLPTH